MSKLLEVLCKKIFKCQKQKKKYLQESLCCWKRVGGRDWKKGVKDGGEREEREEDGERENERSLPKDILVKNPYFAFLTFSAMNNSFL